MDLIEVHFMASAIKLLKLKLFPRQAKPLPQQVTSS
jgi:hypothetical protein